MTREGLTRERGRVERGREGGYDEGERQNKGEREGMKRERGGRGRV